MKLIIMFAVGHNKMAGCMEHISHTLQGLDPNVVVTVNLLQKNETENYRNEPSNKLILSLTDIV
jgi:hypothetical protein